MKYGLLFWLAFLTAAPNGFAQATDSSIRFPLLPNEQWWGGTVQYGYRMPFNKTATFSLNLYGDRSNNQNAPLLISNQG